jgi:putative endonuclease
MRDLEPCVYILASQRNGTLYIGVTSDVIGRISEHKQSLTPGFTSRYQVKLLVHLEYFDTLDVAIAREKQLKKWSRAGKIDLIERGNPTWRDLYFDVSGLIEGPNSMQ